VVRSADWMSMGVAHGCEGDSSGTPISGYPEAHSKVEKEVYESGGAPAKPVNNLVTKPQAKAVTHGAVGCRSLQRQSPAFAEDWCWIGYASPASHRVISLPCRRTRSSFSLAACAGASAPAVIEFLGSETGLTKCAWFS
jgi:hypothetical protein